MPGEAAAVLFSFDADDTPDAGDAHLAGQAEAVLQSDGVTWLVVDSHRRVLTRWPFRGSHIKSVPLSYLGTHFKECPTGEEPAMMTVVTTVSLKDEARNEWDRAMHERVRAASGMEGWVAVQLLREVDEPRRRAIIGTWQSREHWARWHDDETFKATRAELAGLEDGPSTTVWYDVVEEQG